MKLRWTILTVAAVVMWQPAMACGPFFKATLLSTWQEGKPLLAAPVADLAAELKSARGAPALPMDTGWTPRATGRTAPPLPDGLTVNEEGLGGEAQAVLRCDLADLGEALVEKPGRLGVLAGYARIRREMLAGAPELLDGKTLAALSGAAVWPAGLPEEFERYARGARLFHEGRRDEAALEWEAVLNLPAEKRRFRGTWAAWMLGRMSYAKNPAAAVGWFRRVREEAMAGHDSLNRAAASLGWEAMAEEKVMEGEPDGFSVKRAERILWMLARHAEAGGGEPYHLSGHHHATLQALAVWRISRLTEEWLTVPARAEACAGSPWLKEVVTISLLPISRGTPWSGEVSEVGVSPASRWLEALEKVAGGGQEDLGDRLAWAAYDAGDYAAAGRWLARAMNSPMADWLRAKLALQEGRMAEAARFLEKARPGFEIKGPQQDRHEDYDGYPLDASALQKEQFHADLGLVRLAQDDFAGSLDALSRSGFTEDAAYVLEQVATSEEVIGYAVKWPLEAEFKGPEDRLPSPLTVAGLQVWLQERQADGERPVPSEGGEGMEDYSGNGMLHTVVARRLAREDNTKVSREFLPARLRPVLDLFLKHREAGQNKSLPKAERAAAFWRAALIHRYFGMELWGYEGFPDNSAVGGAFEAEDLRSFRLGTLKRVEGDSRGLPEIFPPVSKAEQQRLAENAPRPGKRFNYRYHAYALARQAFALMPDNSEDLAAMIELTGSWFAKFDEPVARLCAEELRKRCPVRSPRKPVEANGQQVPMENGVEARLKRLD